jgi:hypothetical protein
MKLPRDIGGDELAALPKNMASSRCARPEATSGCLHI